MGTNFVTPMKTAITAMVADGFTNAEDAIDQDDGPLGFSNQNGLPAESRVQQFAIFFSDGRPNTIRWSSSTRTPPMDAVAHCEGNCDHARRKAMNHNFQARNGQNLVVNAVRSRA